MYTDGRHTQPQCQRSPGRRPYHQRSDQAWARGVGNSIHIRKLQVSLGHHFTDQRQQLAHMVAGGQFRHHTTVFRVHLDLTI